MVCPIGALYARGNRNLRHPNNVALWYHDQFGKTKENLAPNEENCFTSVLNLSMIFYIEILHLQKKVISWNIIIILRNINIQISLTS